MISTFVAFIDLRYMLACTGVCEELRERIVALPSAYFSTEKTFAAVLALTKVLNNSIAISTIRKYHTAWTLFKAWLPAGVNVFNPSECNGMVVALYLAYLVENAAASGTGPQAVAVASCAIAHFFRLANLRSPTEDSICSVVRKSAENILTPQKSDRQPITAHELKSVLMFHLVAGCSLKIRMHLTVFLLMFVGLLRFDDAASLLVHEDLMRFVSISGMDQGDDGILLFLPRSKMDQTWEGQWVAIGATGGDLCPVALLRQLLQAGGYVVNHMSDDCGPLLRALRWQPRSRTHQLQQVTAPMHSPIPALSYTTFRASIKLLVSLAGIDKNIGLHSCRIGGASHAATIPDVPARLMCTLGRWKHANMMDNTYVRLLDVQARKFFDLTRQLWQG